MRIPLWSSMNKLVWTVVIFNDIEATGLISNGRLSGAYKSLEANKGGSSEASRTPLAYGPDYAI